MFWPQLDNMSGVIREIHIDLAPILLGDGIWLFDHLNRPGVLRRLKSSAAFYKSRDSRSL